MPHNIQTFSDLTDIDTRGQLKVELSVTRHGHTVSLVMLHNCPIHEDRFTMWLDLFEPIPLVVDLIEFDEGTSGLEIGLTVNGLEVLPKYQHLSSNTKCYIDTKELWTFDIPSNFYQWYHEISGQGWIA
jgi:hypothetical protein